MSTIRIVLADDHAVVRAGLAALLTSQPGLEVVGQASDGQAAVEQATSLCPDLAVLDLALPILNGIEAARRIRAQCPTTRVLILTVHEASACMEEVFQAGAGGYISGRATPEELLHAIGVVARGGAYVGPMLGGPALDGLSAGSSARSPGRVELSGRECEVLRLIAQGFSNKEIAARLRISVKTVETHKARGMDKLGFRSRVDVVRHALRRGWLRELEPLADRP